MVCVLWWASPSGSGLQTDAQVVALQETKAHPDQLTEEVRDPEGWESHWSWSTVKKGYSGVAVFSKVPSLHASIELPQPEFQGEGRLLHLEYPQFHFFNGYFPNGGAEELDDNGKPTGRFKRVPYKMGFLRLLAYAEECRKSKPIVVCGDFNIAHRPIDLARPKQNEKYTGYLARRTRLSGSFYGHGLCGYLSSCSRRGRGQLFMVVVQKPGPRKERGLAH